MFIVFRVWSKANLSEPHIISALSFVLTPLSTTISNFKLTTDKHFVRVETLERTVTFTSVLELQHAVAYF